MEQPGGRTHREVGELMAIMAKRGDRNPPKFEGKAPLDIEEAVAAARGQTRCGGSPPSCTPSAKRRSAVTGQGLWRLRGKSSWTTTATGARPGRLGQRLRLADLTAVPLLHPAFRPTAARRRRPGGAGRAPAGTAGARPEQRVVVWSPGSFHMTAGGPAEWIAGSWEVGRLQGLVDGDPARRWFPRAGLVAVLGTGVRRWRRGRMAQFLRIPALLRPSILMISDGPKVGDRGPVVPQWPPRPRAISDE